MINFDPFDIDLFLRKDMAVIRRFREMQNFKFGDFVGTPFEPTDILTPWTRVNLKYPIRAPGGRYEYFQAFTKLLCKIEANNPLYTTNLFHKIIKHKKQEEWKLSEINLAGPVIKHFVDMGYKYAQEWFNVDLVFFKNDHIIAVELKKSLSKKVIFQAWNDYYYAHLAYAAVGTMPRATSLEKAKEHGIGVIAVNTGGIEILLPAPKKKEATNWRDKCLKQLKEADEKGYLCNKDIIAGRPNMRGEGPAQICKRRVNEYLKTHPNATWKEIYANVQNHYSSFRSMQSALSKCI